MPPTRPNLWLGLIVLALSLAVALVWVPLDSGTGLVETVRRRTVIGDALAPTLAAVLLGLGAAMVLISDRDAPAQPTLTRANLIFIAGFLLALAAVFAVMRWAGPLAVALAGGDEPYRLLRDTAPWKWTGFALGGFALVTGLIAAVERRLSLRAVLVGLAAVVALIAVFDLPFDDLLLPPNGDV